MGAPSTSVLDDFNRANNTDIGSNWNKPVEITSDTPRIVSNQFNPLVTTSRASDGAWVTTFSANQESFITIGTLDSGNTDDYIYVYVVLSNLNSSTLRGYSLVVENNSTWVIYRIDNGVFIALGSTVSQTLSSGDKIGVVRNGTTGDLEGWYMASGGSWSLLMTRNDTTYTTGGYIGCGCNRQWTLDDFGGGDTVTISDIPQFVDAPTATSPFDYDTFYQIPLSANLSAPEMALGFGAQLVEGQPLPPRLAAGAFDFYWAGLPDSAGGSTQFLSVSGALDFAGALRKQPRMNEAATISFLGVIRKQPRMTTEGVAVFAGTLRKLPRMTVEGAVSFAGALRRRAGKWISGAVSFVGVGRRRPGMTAEGVTSFNGAIRKQPRKRFAGVVSFAGVVQTTRVKLLALVGALGLAGALRKQTRMTTEGALGLGGVLRKRANKLPSGVLNTSGTLATVRVKLLALAGALGLSGALRRQPRMNVEGVTSFAGALRKAVRVTVEGVASFSGVVGVLRVVQLFIAGAVSFAGGLSKQPRKVLAGLLTTSGTLVRSARKRLGSALGLTGTVGKKARSTTGGALSLSGTLSKQPRATVGGTVGFVGMLRKAVSVRLGGVVSFIGLADLRTAISGAIRALFKGMWRALFKRGELTMFTLARNQANVITFVLIDANGNEVTGLGGGFAVQLSKNAGAFGASAGAKAELGNGWYSYTTTASECGTRGPLSVRVTGAGVVQQNLAYNIEGANAGAIEFVYTMTSTVDGSPIAECEVWVSTDAGGNNVIARAFTDSFGGVRFWLDPGTYYFWRQKTGWQFANPDSEVVS